MEPGGREAAQGVGWEGCGQLRRTRTRTQKCYTPFRDPHRCPAGEGELPGLTDEEKPKMRGPKRASRIRKMFNLAKEDDVRHYVKIYGKKVRKREGESGGEGGEGEGGERRRTKAGASAAGLIEGAVGLGRQEVFWIPG